MEKLFLSGKWFVGFCALFIVVWAALQIVANMRLESEAQMIGDEVFSWFWSGENVQSKAQMDEASIERKSDNDALVRVKGKQTLIRYNPGETLDISGGRSETVDCSAMLTLYRKNDKWVLGRVEF